MKHCVALTIALLIHLPAFAQDEAGFKPIFDGQSLTGWKPWQGDEKFWRVENGTIIGESTPENPCKNNTFLVWDHGQVDDFELRLQFRISGSDQANSGIQFRGTQRDDGHVIGYQADIDRKGQWVGALYDEAQRGVIATRGQKTTMTKAAERKAEDVASAEELFKKIHINDWNDYSIAARGNHITLKINGDVTAEVIDEDPKGLDLHGLLALQLHSGPPMKIEWKNIRLKRFPLSEGRKKVVFVAGSPSHGYMSHEHNAGCLLLADKLTSAAKQDGLPIVATVYTNGWPKDPTAFDNADTVVSYCDGGGRHYLNDHLADFDALVEERGVGLVCIHYAVETTAGDCGNHFLEWMGGFFEPHWSVNPHWDGKFDKFPEHPITRGVKPFEVNDEWYYHMRFVPEMQGVTPILTALPPNETLSRPDGPHSGNPHVRAAVLERKEPQHTAWAYERTGDKGRGFGFTGGHFHKNWQDDNFRKLVLNAIVWTAHGEVPSEGVNSATPTQEELEANQDEPKPQPKQAAAAPNQSAPGSDGEPADRRAAFSSRLNPTTPGHAVEVDVDVTGAKSLHLVVLDGGDGFGCDWADWAEPRLISADSEIKLTDLKWKSAKSGWGEVRVNQNANGAPLRIAGSSAAFGIGTHSNSIVEYELPANHTFTRFKARAGLDNGGTDQGCGSTVQIQVYTQQPERRILEVAAIGPGDPVPEAHESAVAVEQLDVHPELEARLFASEPMMTNPASIDIDHLGRVWVCEAINYRAFRNADIIGDRKEGDRILVLEDADGDAQADKSTVFYQGHDIDSAHGIMVMPTVDGKGLKAIVSALENVFFLIDDDGDLKADRKELLFTGISGAQHDHGIHAFHFGPDGKLYFNFGNAGEQIKDKDGKPIIDKMGNEVNNTRQPYQEGMIFRCNLDGSEFETLAWNFRNNWEVCVDSFGTMWQSDNDDDGNQGVRINYVMEYGNYGYKDELSGAAWNQPRTNWESEIPKRHWHLNDPGVVPNMLQTGAGAPTGICFYEGDLLPKVFQGAVLHCDAGPNICRAYIPKADGAGYTAETVNILDGARNKWFRPSDVCIAPDGSILVADWYDPGVGGHRMQDAAHGRIFRVTPKGDIAGRYASASVDLSTPDGAIEALKSPNMAMRYMAWTALHGMGEKAEPVLMALRSHGKPHEQARALWLLGKLGLSRERTASVVVDAFKDANLDLRIAGLRLARQLLGKVNLIHLDLRDAVSLDDPSPALRREILIGMREMKPEWLPAEARDHMLAQGWAQLASIHDGQDRWYLEALGIAADGRWDQFLGKLDSEYGGPWRSSKWGRDIVWRSRGMSSTDRLAKLILNPKTPLEDLPRYFRALDFQPTQAVEKTVPDLAFGEHGDLDAQRVSFIRTEALSRLQGFDVSKDPRYKAALDKALNDAVGTEQFVRLVDKFGLTDRYPQLLTMAQDQPESQIAIEAMSALYGKKEWDLIGKSLWSDDVELTGKTMLAMATTGDGRGNGPLLALMADENRPVNVRRQAVKAIGSSLPGAQKLLDMAQKKECPEVLKEAFAATLNAVPWRSVREPAAAIFPPPPGKDSTPLPPLSQLVEMKGDVANGRIMFNTTGTCNKCHKVNGIGNEIGPDLSEIGKKLARQAMFESILYPSAAISHNYETWLVVTDDGLLHSGLLVSETDAEVKLKDEKGLIRTIPRKSIEEKRKSDVSLMPADIQKLVTAQELVDIVEYATTLKEKK